MRPGGYYSLVWSNHQSCRTLTNFPWLARNIASMQWIMIFEARFCNMQGLRIRRKTRRNRISGRLIWWFVIHADEAVLSDLDGKWDSQWWMQDFWKGGSVTILRTKRVRKKNEPRPLSLKTTPIFVSVHVQTSWTLNQCTIKARRHHY